MAIGCDPSRNTISNRTGRAEECFGGGPVPRLTEINIHQIPVPIYRTVPIGPAALHFQIGLIRVPACPYLSTSLLTQGLAQNGCKFSFPLPDGFMGKGYPTIETHLGQITQTEFVTDAPQHHATDDIRRIEQTVEE